MPLAIVKYHITINAIIHYNFTRTFGDVRFVHESWEDVAVVDTEIVMWTKHVGGDDGRELAAMLLVVGSAMEEDSGDETLVCYHRCKAAGQTTSPPIQPAVGICTGARQISGKTLLKISGISHLQNDIVCLLWNMKRCQSKYIFFIRPFPIYFTLNIKHTCSEHQSVSLHKNSQS